jgi:hypothetical protein
MEPGPDQSGGDHREDRDVDRRREDEEEQRDRDRRTGDDEHHPEVHDRGNPEGVGGTLVGCVADGTAAGQAGHKGEGASAHTRPQGARGAVGRRRRHETPAPFARLYAYVPV